MLRSNVDCTITVCTILPVARFASKLQAVPIGFLCMTTLRTSLAGKGWTNKVHPNTFRSSLVANEKLAQSKRPAMISGSLFVMSWLLAVANASEVFHHDSLCTNRFSKSNQSLTCDVEHLLRYGFFSSTQTLQATMSRASANAGYFGSGLTDTKATMIKFTTLDIQGSIGFWFYGSEQVLLSTVNADNGSFGFSLWDINMDSKYKEAGFANELQFGVAPTAFWNVATFVFGSRSPDGHSVASQVEVTLPANRDIEFLVDSEAPLLVGLHGPVGGDDVSKEATGDLTGQLKLLTDGSVELSRQAGSGRWFASVKDDFGQPVGSVAVCNGYFEQPWVVGDEFQLGSPDRFHTLLLSVEVAETFNDLDYFAKERRVGQ
jgi:hypothetical protein